MKSKISKIIEYFLIVLSSIIMGLAFFIKYRFGDAKAEQLLYSLFHAEGTSKVVILNGALFILPFVIIGVLLFIFLTNKRTNKQTYFNISAMKHKLNIRIYPIYHTMIFSIIVFLTSLVVFFSFIELFTYIKNSREESTFYETYYVNPDSVELTFPTNKRNLIYIYVESLESTYERVELNDKTVNLIPKLKKIADENINISNDSDFGGYYNIYGTDWTIAATIAQTAGIPLKLIIGGNDYTGYSSFLPGVTALGDILKKEGYQQYYMIGSEANFGGRDAYFKTHGNYTILDVNWARKEKKISSDYNVNWGFEDSKLFDYSKEKLLDISQTKQPFNFTILTSNTHTPDGLTEQGCSLKYNYKYANSIKCADDMVSDFINWIKEQSFYKNTTIIVVGDHLTMQGDITKYVNGEERYGYNTIINSKVEPVNKNNRIFTSLDFFPTTLASIGVKIPGDRLGLGTNLFSNKETLIEELGFEKLNSEVSKNSSYYNNIFLQENYYDMLEK